MSINMHGICWRLVGCGSFVVMSTASTNCWHATPPANRSTLNERLKTHHQQQHAHGKHPPHLVTNKLGGGLCGRLRGLDCGIIFWWPVVLPFFPCAIQILIRNKAHTAHLRLGRRKKKGGKQGVKKEHSLVVVVDKNRRKKIFFLTLFDFPKTQKEKS